MKGDRSAPPAAKIFHGRPKESPKKIEKKKEEMLCANPPRGGGGGDRYATDLDLITQITYYHVIK